ncbi:MAG: type II and III secretion system protein [Gammaproteobacteria bacterium]|nr:type II and III secretion system protein [Gammaproteobacteria bacterium]MDP2349474.1 type II and III secretion system protein [Gammaproteobacteria bacterium]
MNRHVANGFLGVAGICLLTTCGTSLPVENADSRHLLPPVEVVSENIPDVVTPLNLLPAPQVATAPELYSVVVQDASVRELLFAIARDAGVNIDVHPQVLGIVSLNAIDQTLPQILDRISRQVDMRWSMDLTNGLMVEPDSPYLYTYRVDYVNVARESTTSFNSSSTISSVGGAQGGGTGNNSAATLDQSSSNDFWARLTSNLQTIVGEGGEGSGTTVSSVITNPESGIVIVRATSRQHQEIRSFLDFVGTRSLYQVLIEATVVEVSLNDRYQAGVDWALLSRDGGQVEFLQSMSGVNLSTSPASVLTIDKGAGPDAITATIRMLSQFGDLKVLSSPKIMALNNQAAMLRVVDNKVYFTIEVEPGTAATATSPAIAPTYSSTIFTVPVGFTMSVTPQISENDQVTLNVRPTISRIVRYVNDPSPALADAGVINAIPEIQIREIESILKVYSGQIAVLGGLMQDSLETSTAGVPGLSRLPGIGGLFSYKDDTAVKTELIVFIRPVVVRQPSLDGDLQQYRDFLPAEGLSGNGLFSSQFRNPVQR